MFLLHIKKYYNNNNIMNILCIFNNCKSVQYIFNAIIELSKTNKIYYYLNHQMSIKNILTKNLYIHKKFDVRYNIIEILNENNCIETCNIESLLKKTNIDIVIIDDSNGVWKGKNHGYNKIYETIKKINYKIPIVGIIEVKLKKQRWG